MEENGRMKTGERKSVEEEEEEEEEEEDCGGDADRHLQVWSWGAGTEGQLGTGRLQDQYLPHLLPDYFSSSIGSISQLSCGGAHVVALVSCGRVMTWGRGSSGQLGHGELVQSLQPRVVEALSSSIITNVSAGWNHSGFVSDTGALFTCGDGSFGQLGHGDYKSCTYPTQVSSLASKPVCQIACGMRHSLVLLQEAALGWNHALLLSGDDSLCILGEYLGRSHGMMPLKDSPAGAKHSALVIEDGSVMTWGWAEHGQLGLGNTEDQASPKIVNLHYTFFDKDAKPRLYCGSGFTFYVRSSSKDYIFRASC